MPPKRKAAYDDSGAEPSQANLSKRSREEEPDTFETDDAVRRSSRRGKGSGGQLARMKDFERLQTTMVARSKRLNDLDAATEGYDLNPMAPSQPPTTYEAPSSKPRPKPRLKTKAGGSASELRPPLPPTVQPSFQLAAPGGKFGFRLPEVGRRDLDISSTSGGHRSREGSIFSAGSRPSTAPTSRAHSVCSSQGDPNAIQRGHSSHLKRFVHASQSGVEAPRRLSRVTEDVAALRLSQQSSQPESQDRKQLNMAGLPPRSQEPTSHSEDLGGLSPPLRPIGLRRTALLFDRPSHSLFTAPEEDQDQDDPIDETAPSEDERFAESVLRGGEHGAEFFPRGEDYVREQSEVHSSGQVPSNNRSPIDHAEDVVPAHRRWAHQRHEMRNGSDTERSIQVPSSHDNDRGSTDSQAQDAMVTHRRRTHRQSEARDPSDTEQGSGQVPSQSPDRAGGSTNSQSQDVVLAHRQRNRAPRLPSSSQLASIRDQQYSQPQSTTRSPSASLQESGTANQAQRMIPPASVSSQLLGTVAPVGPATEGAEPWQIQFYKPAVQDILERAKQFSHCDAASVDAFPVRGYFKSLAFEYVEEAISERRARGLPVTDGWWPYYTNEISRLLWEDLGNWRSALRKKARIYVTQRYKWDPENRRQVNCEIAKGLLGSHGDFLRNGVDEEGHTNNLAHPALAGLIIDFFYTGPSSLGKRFPEVFTAEVPRVTVAIAATALKVILDEMVSSQAEVNFRVNTYSPVYLELLGLMRKCDTSAIHAQKTQALRIEWARQGNNCVTERETVTTASTGFDVELD